MGEIKKLLATNNWRIINLNLSKNLGLQESFIISELCNTYEWAKENNKLEEGYFYLTHPSIMKLLNISEPTIIRILNKLSEMNIIEIKKKGLPCKNYYKINENELKKYIS